MTERTENDRPEWACRTCGASGTLWESIWHACQVSRVQAIEAAEDHADQTAFDAWRERGL